MSSEPEVTGIKSETLTAGIITIRTRHWVVTVAEKTVDLTYIEYLLLKVLMTEKGKVVTRQMLLERVWGYGNASQLATRTVDVHIGRLRKKLGSASNHIITVRNVGYRMAVSPEWISR